MSSSWKLESSQTIQASAASAPSSPVSGRPTFPATATGRLGGAEDRAEELARRRLPVRAGDADERVGRGAASRARSRSRSCRPRARAAATRGASLGTPGLLTSRSTSSRSAGSSAPRTTSTPCCAKPPGVELLVPVDADDADAPPCERERRGLARAGEAEDEGPLRKQSSERSGSRGRSAQAQRIAVDDPEADHDPRLRPGLHLEVVVERRHQEARACRSA